MKKVATVLNLALKALGIVSASALGIVSASKQKFYICDQKDLKFTKNPACSPFR